MGWVSSEMCYGWEGGRLLLVLVLTAGLVLACVGEDMYRTDKISLGLYRNSFCHIHMHSYVTDLCNSNNDPKLTITYFM